MMPIQMSDKDDFRRMIKKVDLIQHTVNVEQTGRPVMVLFLIKYLMMLVVGIPSVFWVGSKKTCFEWANFVHGRRRKDSSGVNESRQVLQEQPDLAQSLLREPNTPVIRKSRGTSTQGTSTHASSTHLAVLDDLDEPVRTHHGPLASTRSKASSVHSKSSYHGSLRRTRDDRSDTMFYRGTEQLSFHGSISHLNHPGSTHSSLHRLDGRSRHGSQQNVSEAPPALITHGSTVSVSGIPENDGSSA
ncbi:frizzled-3-like isoform X5 [Channa argus]|uniref:frizzled-3-like isoform X5 n=1 Tax=Channa argus TaxID=215402 RepID=UPI00351FAA44